jgi:hypothetical protein
MEPSTFFKCCLGMYISGAMAGYAIRKNGVDKMIMSRVRARIERNQRSYARILGEEISSRIIIVAPAPELVNQVPEAKL